MTQKTTFAVLCLLFLLRAEILVPQDQSEREAEECLITQKLDPPVELADQIEQAIRGNCRAIRLEAGEWNVSRRIRIVNHPGPIWIRGSFEPTVLRHTVSPSWLLERVSNFRLENLTIEGSIELDQTDKVEFKGIRFIRGGLVLSGKKCNQPNECTSFHRNVRIEDCTFEDSPRGIFAERLENSFILRNRFTGTKLAPSCERETVGIELDGSGEDIDRPLEQGHSKGNLILHNTFEQDFAIGIRLKQSVANVIRENQFRRSYRALELLEDSRHNQAISNYIGYLSQQSVTSACPAACGIYTGPASVNNIFINNFFEQNFELQFLETNRNRTFVIDESGGLNVFRSDFQAIRQ